MSPVKTEPEPLRRPCTLRLNTFPQIPTFSPSQASIQRRLYFTWMSICLYVCLCTPCMTGVCGGPKRDSDPLELELAMG